MRRTFTGLLLTAILAVNAAADCDDTVVGIPDLGLSVVTWGLGAGESAILLVVPDGSGAAPTAARRPDGSAVDATITLTVIDGCGDAVAQFPREDIWLEPTGGTFTACLGGTIADRDTDAFGRTVWSQPLHAGGHSPGPCVVVISGSPVPGSLAPPLLFNSPDLNGDLVVSLVDVGVFAAAYFGSYASAADLHADGMLNLGDIGVLAGGLGADCP